MSVALGCATRAHTQKDSKEPAVAEITAEEKQIPRLYSSARPELRVAGANEFNSHILKTVR